jgi:hypothetical protein
MILPCDCPSTAHCLEATGGEQGLSADELEVARLRRELTEVTAQRDEAQRDADRSTAAYLAAGGELARYVTVAASLRDALEVTPGAMIEEVVTAARSVREKRDELRREVERRDALIRADGYEDMRQHAAELAQRNEALVREFELRGLRDPNGPYCVPAYGDVYAPTDFEGVVPTGAIAVDTKALLATVAKLGQGPDLAKFGSVNDVLIKIVGAKCEPESLEATSQRVAAWYDSVRRGLTDALRQRDELRRERNHLAGLSSFLATEGRQLTAQLENSITTIVAYRSALAAVLAEDAERRARELRPESRVQAQARELLQGAA